MVHFITNRSIYYNYESSSVYDTTYLFNFDMSDGRILVFNNSMFDTPSEQQENKTFRCTSIAFLGIEIFYFLKQYSIYFKVEYISTNIDYMAVRTNSPRYVPTSSLGVVHYFGWYESDYQHMISLVAPVLQKTSLSDAAHSYFYISVTQELNCTNKLNVVFSTSQFPTDNHTKTIMLLNHMYFNGPSVYFNTMYGLLNIVSLYFPRCEVVFSYKLVSVKKIDKHQEDCMHGYNKVKLIYYLLLVKFKRIINTFRTLARLSTQF